MKTQANPRDAMAPSFTKGRRLTGKIRQWNDERGFGFIAPADGKRDIFVHVSDFPPRHGARPRQDLEVSFDLKFDSTTRKLKATHVMVIEPASTPPPCVGLQATKFRPCTSSGRTRLSCQLSCDSHLPGTFRDHVRPLAGSDMGRVALRRHEHAVLHRLQHGQAGGTPRPMAHFRAPVAGAGTARRMAGCHRCPAVPAT